METPSRALGELAHEAAAHSRVLILLDYDGTLCKIRARPSQARLNRARRELLARLVAGPQRLAILSGRAVPQLRRLLGISGVYYGGNFGLVIEGPGLRFTHPQVRGSRLVLAREARRLTQLFSDLPGVWIEHKGAGLSLHFRGVPSAKRPALRRFLARARRDSPRGLVWKPGLRAWEILPTGGWDKGRAALLLWRRLGRPYLVAVGDDCSDEPMFEAVRGRGAAIKVGRAGRTAATHRVAGVASVYSFLGLLAHRSPVSCERA
jgi:trehalose-phosphatase